MPRTTRPYGPNTDHRFHLHHRQPRADKLDARQRTICRADPAYAEALRQRVSDERRFSAFMAGQTFYVDFRSSCGKCGNFKRRTRDRSCYACHLGRSGENFERMKASLPPIAHRSRDSHIDLLDRQRRERADEHTTYEVAGITAKRWPTGKLEISFPHGHTEPDFSKLDWQTCMDALGMYPDLRDVLRWAGWSVD